MAELIERRHLPYTPAQLFDLAADVARYPEFAPGISGARVYRRAEDKIWTEMLVGTGLLRKRFSTVAALERPHRIVVSSYDPIFERFEQQWAFAPAPQGGTDVEYRVDLRFRSPLFQLMLARSLAGRADAMISAFVRRARALYGRAA